MKEKILYLPVARLTFDVETARKYFKESKALLETIAKTVISPPDLLTDAESLRSFVQTHANDAQIIVFQNITFTDGEFILNVLEQTTKPLLCWGVREPSVGGWLRLNSLTGMMSTANVLYNQQKKALSLIGNPSETELQAELQEKLEILAVISRVNSLKLGVIGTYPNGFFFSGSDDKALAKTFGVELKTYDLAKTFEQAKQLPPEVYNSEIDYAQKRVIGLHKTDENVKKFAQFVSCVKQKIADDKLKSIAMRCWPDFFTELKAAPCGIFSQLTEQGFPTSCETDIHGSLSMYILKEMTGGLATYLGDVVHFKAVENTIVLWHCGFGPYSLANQKTGATAGLHPNRKLGFAMEFGLKPGQVTLFRVGFGPEGYRFIISKGQALDVPNSYNGTSAEIKLETDVTNFIKLSLKEGFEPHFALVYGDVTSQLKQMAEYLNLPVIEC
ncbi:MAG: hypothetical protein ACRC6X_02760 [Culicoidibacterales bacterium]